MSWFRVWDPEDGEDAEEGAGKIEAYDDEAAAEQWVRSLDPDFDSTEFLVHVKAIDGPDAGEITKVEVTVDYSPSYYASRVES